MKKASLWLVVLLIAISMISIFLVNGCKVEEEAADLTDVTPADSITIHWAQWAPADNLQELSADFTEETGIEVIVEQTPWETFVQKYNVEMTAQSDAWDIIVADSQDIGNMAINGHFVELTDFVEEQGILDSFLPSAMYNYAEYPKGYERYWCVPVEGDALGWAYRKDLFEDSDNMAAFEDEYGYALDVPTSWDMLKDIAEFFHDPDNEFYGVAIYGDNGYDSLAMFAEQTIRAYGGDLGNFETFEVDGYLNNEGAIAGLEYYRDLYQFVPPGFGDAFYVATNDAFVNGLVPMATNYFAFFPALSNPDTNPYADVTGYFTCPPQEGVDGVVRQSVALGGQGAGIVSYISDEKKAAAFKWLEWFGKEETHAMWATMPGSFTTHEGVLNSPEFLAAAPYNPNMLESFELLQDWWAVPQYDTMIRSFSEILGEYVISGEGTAEEALQEVTDLWTEIFEEDGYYDPDFDPNDF